MTNEPSPQPHYFMITEEELQKFFWEESLEESEIYFKVKSRNVPNLIGAIEKLREENESLKTMHIGNSVEKVLDKIRDKILEHYGECDKKDDDLLELLEDYKEWGDVEP